MSYQTELNDMGAQAARLRRHGLAAEKQLGNVLGIFLPTEDAKRLANYLDAIGEARVEFRKRAATR